MKRQLLVLGFSLAATPAMAACDDLRALAVPAATVTDAGVVTSLVIGGAAVPLAKPACRVLVTARPSADSDVRIAVVIPEGAAWNGKFVQVGNGGFAGQIPWFLITLAVSKGYAAAGTDDGHQDSDGTSAKWALGHPEKVTDFGWRAVKTTTDVAKAVMAAHGPAPSRNYFFGCSDGGREALMTAQRYPRDFDGIVAGAPAWPWTRMLGIAGEVVKESLLPGRSLPATKLPALQAAAIAACGYGERYIADPRACRFDPGVLACKGGDTATCLLPGEVKTARLLYNGRRDPVTGKPFPGLTPGAESLPGSWGSWGRAAGSDPAAEATSRGFPWNHFAYLVKDDPRFDLRNLTAADIRAGHKRWAGTLNADNPDLRAFQAAGGKLLSYHGWNDPAISPGLSLEYRAAALKATPGLDSSYRLFMVPGMLHCSGGDAPVTVDWLAVLDDWVASSAAPQTLTATHGDGRTQTLVAER